MKSLKIKLAALIIAVLPAINLTAQEKGDGNITKQDRIVANFDAINVGCAINLFLSQGEVQSVAVETDENLQNRIKTEVNNGELILSCDKVRNASKMNVYVTVTKLTKLDANGASVVDGITPVSSDKFSLYTSGASKIKMELDAKTIYNEASGASKETLVIKAESVKSEVSGAANVNYSGTANEHSTEVSGAGNLRALEFVTDQTDAEISGAGNASVMARKQLKADLSGAGTLTYFDNSEVKKIGKAGEYTLKFSGMDNVKTVIIDDGAQTDENNNEESVIKSEKDDEGNVEVTINNGRIVVVTDDTVKVKLGNNMIEFGDDGDAKVKRTHKKQQFNGHWAGFELGVNGYLTPDNDFELPENYKLLDLKYQKSINVNLNFFEQNVTLVKNHLGLVTGLGISWNNYRFDNDVRLDKVEKKLELRRDSQEKSYEKSKLVNTYFTLPLMLEVQTNRYSKLNSFHVSGGVVAGWRIGTHTKYVFDDGSRQKVKDRQDFYMNPFKLDAIAKIGWGVLNLYATYSLTPMFQKNKGPELYPFAIGICLTDLSDL